MVIWSASIVLIPFASLLVRRVFPGVSHVVVTMVVGTLVFVGLGFAIQSLWRKPCQRYLREQLIAKGVPICIHCGYCVGYCPHSVLEVENREKSPYAAG